MVLLGDLVDITGGGTPSRKVAEYWGGEIPWATVKDFKSVELKAALESITEEGLNKSASNLIPAGSIIVPTRMAVGKVAINAIDMAINQDLKALIIKDNKKVDSDYLFRSILSKSSYLKRRGKGATVKGITLDVLREMELPLPPLKEQKRIAAILDKADAIRRKRQQAIDLTDQLLRSVFLDMFGDPVTNPKGWDIFPLSTLVSSLEGGKNVKPDESGSETINRILKVSAVTTGIFKPDASKPLPDDFNPPGYYFVNKGDLLISRANTAELIGATAFVHEPQENLILPDKIWRMKWVDSNCVHPLYVHYLFQQAYIRREISIRSSGTSGSMKNIPKPKLLEIPIPIPSANDQKKFGKIAEKLYLTRKSFGGYEEDVNDLFNSLTQQAFNGELSKQTKAA